MKHVSDMGYVFRLSNANYVKVLRAIAQGEGYDLATLGRQVCVIDQNLSGLTAEDAQQELNWIKSAKKED